MSFRFWLACLLFLSFTAARAEALSYQRDIQPIFTAKCVACHACYDSPCQLNLGSGEGASRGARSEEHTSELQSLMRISYAVFCLQKKTIKQDTIIHTKPS